MTGSKLCLRCARSFDVAMFNIKRTNKSGTVLYFPRCKACQKEVDLELHISRGDRACVGPCGQILGPDAFAVNRHECRECKKQKDKISQTKESIASKKERAPPPPTACSGPCQRDFGMKSAEERAQHFSLRTDMVSPTWRTTCHQCEAIAQNGATHSQNSRARRREEDEIGYKQKAAEQAQKYRDTHPEYTDKMNKKQRTDIDSKWKTLIKRGIEVDLEDKERLQRVFVEPCHYCQSKPALGEELQGIDRVDSKIGYFNDNCVSCCPLCYQMKASVPMDTFIGNVRRVVLHSRPAPRSADSTKPRHLSGGVKEAIKDKTSRLTREQKIELWSSACTYCGYGPAESPDRADSSKPHTIDNMLPSCTTCNFMKKNISVQDFVQHVACIYEHTAQWVLSNDQWLNVNWLGAKRQAVQAIDFERESDSICFTSATKAAELVGVDKKGILSVLDTPGICKGLQWTRISDRDYCDSNTSADMCSRILWNTRSWEA